MSGYWNRSSSHERFLRSSSKTKDGNFSDDDDDGGGGWMLTNDLGYIHPRNGKLYFLDVPTMLFALVESRYWPRTWSESS